MQKGFKMDDFYGARSGPIPPLPWPSIPPPFSTWFDVRATVRPSGLSGALERFSDRDNVRVVAHLAGEHNLALFLLCRSVEEADQFVSEEIRTLPGLLDFSLMRVPSVSKFDYNFNL